MRAKPKCTCRADASDPLAFSLAEQEQRVKNCPVHKPYQPMPEGLAQLMTGFSEQRDKPVKRMADAEASNEEEQDDD